MMATGTSARGQVSLCLSECKLKLSYVLPLSENVTIMSKIKTPSALSPICVSSSLLRKRTTEVT